MCEMGSDSCRPAASTAWAAVHPSHGHRPRTGCARSALGPRLLPGPVSGDPPRAAHKPRVALTRVDTWQTSHVSASPRKPPPRCSFRCASPGPRVARPACRPARVSRRGLTLTISISRPRVAACSTALCSAVTDGSPRNRARRSPPSRTGRRP